MASEHSGSIPHASSDSLVYPTVYPENWKNGKKQVLARVPGTF